MQVNIIGKLPESSNLASKDEKLDELKEFSLYILSDENSYKKLQNLIQSLGGTNKKLPIYKIPSSEDMNGYEIIIRVRTINGKLGNKMLDIPRSDWVNKQFLVRFKISGYSFKSRLERNFGEQIKGYNFMLEHIDIC
jgi:hypothetical protein